MRRTVAWTVLALAALGWAGEAWSQQRAPVKSKVTVMERDGSGKRVVYEAERVIEAPNWSPDGRHLIVNSEGRLWRIPVEGGGMELIPTGAVTGINNDHGISPDGKLLVISAGPMYVLPYGGGEPRQVTRLSPSYYHGWSPDGRRLAYCAPREKNFDIIRHRGGRGRGAAADDTSRLRRRTGLLALRQVDLFQLRPDGELGDLADAGGGSRSGG